MKRIAAFAIALALFSQPHLPAQTAAATPAEAELQLTDLRARRAQAQPNQTWNLDSQTLRLLVKFFPDRGTDIQQAIDGLAAAPSGSASLRITTFADAVSVAMAKNVGLAAIDRGMSKALLGLTRDGVAAELSRQRSVPTPTTIDAEYKGYRTQALELLGRVHLALGQLEKADAELREAVAMSPALTSAHTALAGINRARGNERAALDHYLVARLLGGTLEQADETQTLALYRKLHGGSDAGLAEESERAFLAAMPAPPKPPRYTPAAQPTDRVALVQLFTGSGCFPCVASDLAFDALIERYPAGSVALLAYHSHSPAPDPMAIRASEPVQKHVVGMSGVPRLQINGVESFIGGGNVLRAPVVFEQYSAAVDRVLAAAPEAAIALRATRNGDKITVTTTVSDVAAGPRDLQLHVVLAERQLHFHGENGVHMHSMVVRDVAGDPATGTPITAPEKGAVVQSVTFDLASIGAGVATFLDSTIAARRAMAGENGSRLTFRAEGRALTTIAPESLVVVAYVSSPDKRVLQSAMISIGK